MSIFYGSMTQPWGATKSAKFLDFSLKEPFNPIKHYNPLLAACFPLLKNESKKEAVERFEGIVGVLILDYHASFGSSTMDVEVELENIIIDDLNMFLKKKKSFMNRRIQANPERFREIL